MMFLLTDSILSSSSLLPLFVSKKLVQVMFFVSLIKMSAKVLGIVSRTALPRRYLGINVLYPVPSFAPALALACMLVRQSVAP